jgi:hypothetical protein
MDKFVTFYFAIFNASSSNSSLAMSPKKNLAFYKTFTINNVFLPHDSAVLEDLGFLYEVLRFQLDTPHPVGIP